MDTLLVSKGIKSLIARYQSFIISRDVIFHDNIFPFRLVSSSPHISSSNSHKTFVVLPHPISNFIFLYASIHSSYTSNSDTMIKLELPCSSIRNKSRKGGKLQRSRERMRKEENEELCIFLCKFLFVNKYMYLY